MVVGSDLSGNMVFRFTTNGELDTTLNSPTGMAGISTDEAGRAVKIDSSGRLVVTGQRCTGRCDMFLARFTTSGALDTTLNGTGEIVSSIATGGEGMAVTTDANGRILVTGVSNNASTVYNMVIWRDWP